MNNRTKIPAFTLSELIVVLVITSIVIGIAFSVLNLVSKQFRAIENSYEKQAQLIMFKEQLAIDFDQCKEARWDSERQYLSLKIKDREFLYNFQDSTIVQAQDSLLFIYSEKRFYFQGIETQNGLVDALSVTIHLPRKQMQIFVHRRVSAKEQINKLWD